MRRAGIIRVCLALGVLLLPTRAWAHARLVRSDPAAGSIVAASPQLIRLWYSERPEVSLTFVTLTDATGRKFTLGPVQGGTANGLELSIPVVDALPAGKYTVAWRTVAADGHPSQGTFSFAVSGATVGAVPEPQINKAVPPDTLGGAVTSSSAAGGQTSDEGDSASISNSLARAFSFIGLLALIGAVAFRTGVLPRTRGISPEVVSTMRARAASVGVWASILVVIGACARILLESRMIAATLPAGRSMTTSGMLSHTTWGFALALQAVLALVAVVAFAFAARKIQGAWLVAGLCAIVLGATPALAGHAAATAHFTWFVVASDFLHVLGAASWLGSLLCVVVIGLPAVRSLEEGARWQAVASLVDAFSPLALVSAAVVVVSGVIASWVHLDHLSDLWTTSYGKVLLLKLVLVAATLAVGAHNFRRVQPQLGVEGGPDRLRRSATFELSLGFVVVLVTGFLTGIAP
ncbi:MAG: CopD family protein [Gemmatimonadaceae bacterium]